jgi:hypothetical protein
VACSAADALEEIIGYAAVSYPFSVLTFLLMGWALEQANTRKPKLFVMGDKGPLRGGGGGGVHGGVPFLLD